MKVLNKLILEAGTPEEAESAGKKLAAGPFEDSAAAREAAESSYEDAEGVSFAADDDDKWYIYIKENTPMKVEQAKELVEKAASAMKVQQPKKRVKEGWRDKKKASEEWGISYFPEKQELRVYVLDAGARTNVVNTYSGVTWDEDDFEDFAEEFGASPNDLDMEPVLPSSGNYTEWTTIVTKNPLYDLDDLY
ncbi:MAG: hypothetical protein LC687_00445 [Actinobacteria bacterium]|nr:hypothetical protein [Actinomycetota bacterium]MCA1806339.1 hypothetical protein [Actinomycetota bacterium]